MATKKRYVALLRGINVGGKHSVPMRQLAEMFSGAGATEVRTFIQSGNVVFAATPTIAKTIPGTINEAIRKKLGHEVPVVMRSAEKFREALARNPFAKRKDFANFSHLLFCADKLSMANVKKLDAARSPGDEFACSEQEIYLWAPNGVGQTKLTNAYFDRVLETVCTQRNWRTAMKLSEML